MSNAKKQAEEQLVRIIGMVSELNTDDSYEAQKRIQKSPISTKTEVGKYEIVLSPILRITGELTEDRNPLTPNMEYEDMGTWNTYFGVTDEEQETLHEYCYQFDFSG